ncbi:MAG: hypothetical protein R3Y09_06590 [Clostridia bacterium]
MRGEFLIGFGLAMLIGTDKGRTVLKAATNTTGMIAEGAVKFGMETLEETMPSVASAISTASETITSSVAKEKEE